MIPLLLFVIIVLIYPPILFLIPVGIVLFLIIGAIQLCVGFAEENSRIPTTQMSPLMEKIRDKFLMFLGGSTLIGIVFVIGMEILQ